MKTLLTAHSGCDGTPDNSLEYLAYALELDVDCLEVDVRWGKDGAVVLTHDEGNAAATLAQAFAMLKAHPEKRLNCDLKEPDLELPTFALAEETGVAGQIVFSGTVSARATEQMPDLFERVDWFLNIELLFPEIANLGFADAMGAARLPEVVSRIRAAMAETGARCINTHYSIADTPLYAELLGLGVPISVWTPGEERLIRRFLEDGVHNITTRNARHAAEIFAERLRGDREGPARR